MISATKPKESRPRDVQRNRILLVIGDKSWHISQEEGKRLRDELNYLLYSPSKSARVIDIDPVNTNPEGEEDETG